MGTTPEGLFYNKETGQVYPIDPETGRQVRWYDPTTDTHGAFIAGEQGTPYGTFEYSEPTAQGMAAEGVPWAMQTIKSKARGDIEGQPVITGVNPQTGQPYTFAGGGFNVSWSPPAGGTSSGTKTSGTSKISSVGKSVMEKFAGAKW